MPNSAICSFNFCLYRWWQFCRYFLYCVPWKRFWKNNDKSW